MSRNRPANFANQPLTETPDRWSHPNAPENMLDDELQGEFDLVGYWRAIRRQKWGIFGITFSCVIIGAMMALKAVPIYQATVTILAKPIQPTVATTNQYANNALIFLFYETQYEIIKSRAVAARVVDKLGLETQEEARRARQQAASAAAESSGSGVNWRDWIPEELGWLPEGWLEGHGPIEITAEQRREALISRLAGGLVVKGGDQSEIISIKYDSPDPEFAAEFVNAVADAYVAFGLHSRLTSARKTTSWLNDQITELKKKMEESEAALEVYQQNTGMVDTTSRQQVISTKLASLSVEQIKSQTAKSEAEIRYNQVLKIKQKGGGYESLVPVLNSALVLGLNSKYSEMERRVSEYSDRYGHKHPKMMAAKSDLKQADKALQSAINKVVDSIRKEYEFAVAQERRVNALIKKQKREIGDVRGKGFALAKLERKVENNRQLYETFLGRFQEEDVVDEYDISNVRIIDRAIVPMTPIKPNIPRMRMISVVVGLVLGIMFAVLRERLDNTFKTLEHLETKLGLPVLGLAPLLKKIKSSELAERYVSIAPRTPFAEALNHVRTSVLFSNIDKPPKVLLVTSATAGEGKTTLSTNLALAFSTLGRTLLIECDLRKPRFGGIFSHEKRLGLANLVSGQESLGDCVFRDEYDRGELFVLSAGTVPPNPLEFLSSKSFAKTLEALSKHYEHIVIDAPPVLPVSDAIVVSRMVDGVILAVKAESTTYQTANSSLRRLQAAQIQPLGAVLTMADTSRMAYYGGQSYDYYNSGYYGYGEG